MDNLPSYSHLSGLAAITGILTHLLYFIRGEHHVHAPRIVQFYVFSTIVLAAFMYRTTGCDILTSFIATSIVTVSYLAGLLAGLFTYRAFFHRLRKFSGPFQARVSNLYHASLLKNSDNYRIITEMHKKYGPVVRTGPANLSVNIPEAVQIILGSDSKCSKTAWYDASLPLVNLHTARDKKVHERRRKVFSRAFSPKALLEYESRVSVHSELFCCAIAEMKGQPFDATRWFKYFAFDVMGEVGLSESFRMLTEETNRWIPDLLEDGMSDIAQLQPIPWATILLHRLPLIAHGPKRFLEFVTDQAKKRAQRSDVKPDVLSYLVEAYEQSEKKEIDFRWYRGDTRLVIVGGSDTTAATLTYIFYHLASDPSQITKLRGELEPLLQGRAELDPKDVSAAKHLNGIIHEALRLHPPIPSGFPRLTPPEGITINGTYIPGNTTVVLPLWTMGRSEECYPRANEFIPERWYSQPELIKHNVFAPFGLGPYGCIGKHLAMMEIRNMIVHILNSFDVIELAPGEDGHRLLNESKDHFTIGLQPLMMVFDKKDQARDRTDLVKCT